MCGIYITNIPFSIQEINDKLKSIEYRGPDNLGILKKKSVTLGHLRLSILDLDHRSDQPMQFDELYITYNGEIYNFLDLKNELSQLGHKFKTTSDTEVLLIGYKEWGAGILQKINGMFAFCIYDNSKQTLFCARDRIGVKPFYYFWEDGIFEICSQLRPLSSKKEINKEAVSIYLDCGYVPSPYSILDGIHKLPPGHYMEIDIPSKKMTITNYWDLNKVKIRKIPYSQAKTELHKLLTDAVKIRLQSDVPIGSFLSGGIDSALISSIAGKISNTPINTFSIGFDDPKFDESKVAEKFTTYIKSKHKTTICTAKDSLNLLPKLIEVYDEPFADDSALPSLLLNSVTKPYVTVALSGDGGDESFLGYNHFEWVMKYKWIFKIPLFIRKMLSHSFFMKIIGKGSKAATEILATDNLNNYISKVFVGFDSLNKERNLKWLSHYKGYTKWSNDPIQKTADLNIKLWLENDSNVKVDRASMAYSVEVRSPFLDYRIVEFARSLPISFRYQKNNRKRILRDILEEYIPKSVFNQPKKGFSVPLGDWIAVELKDEVLRILSDEFLNTVPNLDVSKFKYQLNQHMEGNRIYFTNIWKVFIYGKWCEEFGFYDFN
ncbi:Asparagine synthetase [glutamine-hydrolyzing] 1 [Arenibacter antarcticus]|uniref:asparagine synthase (glutamine-hydrolyzing) n=1 Tax=Arenibacter antarcticus TaxID=2040469 RepID=A0ABW5VI05_9FLAO|nr:asparagine synthase (glutamine-hydrolyzing) [Arenibacter sp. H213]MCM4167337.1 asparagine synthase (glutamine-hydrolyzing) [Arenibacter sp. H213]